MTGDFLGKGIGFPFTADGGDLAMAAHHESIQQSIWLILSTARGERIMRPDFGCRIHDYLFSVNNAGTIGKIEAAVREALLRWEPRIVVLEVNVSSVPDNMTALLIDIEYRVKKTNSVFNLVHPFYLDGGES